MMLTCIDLVRFATVWWAKKGGTTIIFVGPKSFHSDLCFKINFQIDGHARNIRRTDAFFLLTRSIKGLVLSVLSYIL